jgi:hypothetical protein
MLDYDNETFIHLACLASKVINMTTAFESFLDKVSKVEKIHECEDLNRERQMLLEDPVTAWALANLSARQMQIAEASNDKKAWLMADLIWRPMSVIREEIRREKELDEQLKNTPTMEEKVNARWREERAAFVKMSGTSLDKPDPEKLAAMLGPDSTIVKKLGEKYATEALINFASTKDINVLLPICQSFVKSSKLYDVACQKYMAWETSRNIAAKGTKVLGLFTRVNKEEITRAESHMRQLEQTDPQVKAMMLFRKISAAALKNHGKKVADPTSISEMNNLWASIIQDNKELADFTIKKRDELKQEQLNQGAGLEGKDNKLLNRDKAAADFNQASSPAAIPLADEEPTGKGSLLSKEDIAKIRKKN